MGRKRIRHQVVTRAGRHTPTPETREALVQARAAWRRLREVAPDDQVSYVWLHATTRIGRALDTIEVLYDLRDPILGGGSVMSIARAGTAGMTTTGPARRGGDMAPGGAGCDGWRWRANRFAQTRTACMTARVRWSRLRTWTTSSPAVGVGRTDSIICRDYAIAAIA